MADIMGPDFITLLVRDLERSRQFYAEVLGLKTSPETRPNAAAFATKPTGFAIRKSPADFNPLSQVGDGIIVWFRTADSVALHENLKGRGVAIVQGLSDSPFGKMFTFRDPDGYLLTAHDGG